MAKYVAVRTGCDGTLQIEEFKASSDNKARKLARKLGADVVICNGRPMIVRNASSRKQQESLPA